MILATIGVGIIFLTVTIAVIAVSTVKLWVELKAMQKSTHTVQYVDPRQAAGMVAEDITEKIKEKLHADDFEPIM